MGGFRRPHVLGYYYSETSDISHLQKFQPSSNSSVCRATTFDVWEIPPKILYLL